MPRIRRPQQHRLSWPLTPYQVEALDDMLEELFKSQLRPAAFPPATQASILLGRGSVLGNGSIEEITLGLGLTMTGTELSVSLDLNDLQDVNVPSPNDGDVLTFDNGSGLWIASPPAGTLDALTDVDIDSPQDGDLLQYNSSTMLWENVSADDVIEFAGGRWMPLSNGDLDFPEIIFAGGEVIMVWVTD